MSKYHCSSIKVTTNSWTRFLDLHPAASFPLDIRTYKGFLEYYARITRGRIKERPVPETVEHFRRSFEAALARSRDFVVPESMSITLREVNSLILTLI
jgi:hypothetical protein